jgi:hypothetical protein
MSDKAQLYTAAAEAFSDWHLDDPISNVKQGRSVLLWSSAKREARPKIQVVLPSEAPLKVLSVEMPGPAGKWGSVEVLVESKELLGFLQQLDAYTIATASSKCHGWFGKALACEHLQTMHRPLVCDGRLRLRIDAQTCRFWAARGREKKYVESCMADLQKGHLLLPCVSVNGLYFKAREFGLSVSCSDALIYPCEPMPFHLGEGPEEDGLPEHEDEERSVE